MAKLLTGFLLGILVTVAVFSMLERSAGESPTISAHQSSPSGDSVVESQATASETVAATSDPQSAPSAAPVNSVATSNSLASNMPRT